MAETLWNITTTMQSLCKQQPSNLSEIPRNKLRLKESFGRGCLGEVSSATKYKKTVTHFYPILRQQVLFCELDSDYSNMPQAVAVRSGPSHSNVISPDVLDRQDFLKECRLLASLRHANIAKLVGVTVSEEPYCSILEHSPHGDLYHYLRQISRIVGPNGNSVISSMSTTTSSSSGCESSASPMAVSSSNGSSSTSAGNVATTTNGDNSIHYSRLVDMAAQVASGMKYLESRNTVHKDLSAR